MKPTVGSLFSGIGGLDLAAHWAGFSTAWFVEKEPFCQKVLAKHWPHVPIHDDVFTCKDLPRVDVIVGGFPCQPFSTAGEQNGEQDERFLLLPEMLRIVEEIKPYAVLFENVPGFTNLNDGSAFKFLLGCIAEMGFDGCEWGRISASDIGAPHRRERWFCIAYVVNPSKLVPSNLRKSYAGKFQQAFNYATNQRPNSEPIHGEELAYTLSYGNGISGRRGIDSHQEWDSSQTESERNHKQFRTISYRETMGNPASAGLHQPITTNGRQDTTQDRAGLDNRPERSSNDDTEKSGGEVKSGIRREFDGLPGRLDFVGFPARPGQPQYAYEPPRTAPSTPTTNARIKALGNAVVPQCVFPIFQAIYEWLEEVKQTEII